MSNIRATTFDVTSEELSLMRVAFLAQEKRYRRKFVKSKDDSGGDFIEISDKYSRLTQKVDEATQRLGPQITDKVLLDLVNKGREIFERFQKS